uniref:uncharacterized protein LOC120341430 n=1 Tax=Styela clava TaxID=7725 RepID=UPI0019397AC6|nr:uncharacterized protein LOC120341430 [Styela clava]
MIFYIIMFATLYLTSTKWTVLGSRVLDTDRISDEPLKTVTTISLQNESKSFATSSFPSTTSKQSTDSEAVIKMDKVVQTSNTWIGTQEVTVSQATSTTSSQESAKTWDVIKKITVEPNSLLSVATDKIDLKQFVLSADSRCESHEQCVRQMQIAFQEYCDKIGDKICGSYRLRDFDECSFSNDVSVNNCSANATCTNTYGSYTCQCYKGYDDLNINDPGRNCSQRCFYFDNKCFTLFESTEVDYKTSQLECKEIGGHLANLYNEKHWTDFLKYVRSYNMGSKTTVTNLFLGMTYDPKTNEVFYYNGTKASSSITSNSNLWHSGYPKRDAGYTILLFTLSSGDSSSEQYFTNARPDFMAKYLCELNVH